MRRSGQILKERVCSFYLGRLYPLLICSLVFISSTVGFEILFFFLHAAFASAGLLLTKTVKPFIISLLTFHLQISVKHSPFYPSYSDYFTQGVRPYAMLLLLFAVLGAIFYFSVKRRVFSSALNSGDKVTRALIFLSVTLLFNGVLGGKWAVGNLLFALVNIFVYLFLFVFLLYGQRAGEVSFDYISYISLLVVSVTVLQLLHLFITGDVFQDGSIVKERVALGWGIWNLIGISLVSYIPVLIYGAKKCKRGGIYLLFSTLAFCAATLTLSRNALLCGISVLFLSLVITFYSSKNKRIYASLLLAGVLLAVLAALFFYDRIELVFLDYFNRFLSDNGRFALWREALCEFLSAAIFGVGFYGFTPDTAVFGALPKMAHNFILELACAGGIFALFGYFYWLVTLAREILAAKNKDALLLVLSPLSVLLGSLLDNFVFNIYPMFVFNVILNFKH